jgi:hypothetical protein
MSPTDAGELEAHEVVWARAREHPDPSVRREALRALTKHWPDRAETIAALRYAVRTEPELSTRRDTAAAALSLRWPDETMAWLHDLTTSARDGDRLAAVESLLLAASLDNRHRPAALAAIRARTVDDVPFIRERALRELLRGDRDSPETIAVCRARLADPDPRVRKMAISVLGGGNGDSEIVEELYQLATTDDDETVRDAALSSLSNAKAWPDHPEAIAWLRAHAATPDYVTPQNPKYVLGIPEWTTSLLIDVRFGDPDVRTQVLDLLARSRDDKIRDLMLTCLALNERKDPDISEVLRRLATHEPSTTVRRKAVDTLGWWREDPESLAVLRECVVADPNTEVRLMAYKWLWFNDESRDLLLRRVAEDPAAEIRISLLWDLVDWASWDPRTAPALGDRVRHDRHRQVRRQARKALVTLAKDADEEL